jgi:hypothetical protein
MKDTQSIQGKFIALATEWGAAFSSGDSRSANRHNSAITKLVRQFKNDSVNTKAILVPLLDHAEPAVRLQASVHALDQGIAVEKAEAVLKGIEERRNMGLLPMMARINLIKWNENKSGKMNDEPAG